MSWSCCSTEQPKAESGFEWRKEVGYRINTVFGVIIWPIGMGFFVYGKKQGRLVPLICGLALMVYPYFIENTVIVVVVGILLTVIPFFVRV